VRTERDEAQEKCARLERENADLRTTVVMSDKRKWELIKENAELKRLFEQMRVALLWLHRWVQAEAEHFQANTPDDDILKKVEAALEAAEGGKYEITNR